MTSAGTVFLVGAGPGDPDLITVRGLQLCQSCDALVYDSLVPHELVDKSSAAQKIYVGKTEGGHAMSQEEITALLVSLATAPDGPKRIVRLKGGDPYVFGRGGEEALACQEAGVAFEVVPGVTAGVAAPAYAGVPVTHRQISRGVMFFTGHLANGNLEHLPWQSMATSGFTLVAYMAVSTLDEIAARLMAHGLAGTTPALVVQEGTTPGQRSVSAPLAEIANAAREASIRPPAVTVIGEVAALSGRLGPQSPRPLAGKTVVLLKAEESSYDELAPLRGAGARVIEVPVVRGVASRFARQEEARLVEIEQTHAVYFRSAVAVRFFAAAWRRAGDRPEPRFIAGSPTVRAAAELLGWNILYTEEHSARVVQTLRAAGVTAGTTVWLPRSADAGDELPRSLKEAGFDPRPLRIYQTALVPVPADVRSILSAGRADAVLFLSGSCVEAALTAAPELAGEQGRRVIFGAIGPLTALAATRLGIQCAVVSDPPRLSDLVTALIAKMGGPQSA